MKSWVVAVVVYAGIDKTLSSVLGHALAHGHIFFSIFYHYDKEFPRNRRFMIFFCRLFLLMSFSSLFFQGEGG